jgi:hypothetical protein
MKKTLLLTFALLSGYSCILAQQFNEQPGFIVTTTGDTLKGFIKDRDAIEKTVQFRVDNASNGTTYAPNQVHSFGFNNGSFYHSVEFPATDSTIEQQFIQCLVDGYLSLYRRNRVFYLSKNKGALVKMEKNDVIDQSRLREDKRYQKVLEYLTADCPSVAAEVRRTDFNTESLSNLVAAYNTCKTGVAGNSKIPRKKWYIPQLGAKAGVTLTQFDIKGNATLGLYKFNPEINYSGGLIFNFNLNNKFSFQPEVLVTSKSSTGSRTIFNVTRTYTFDLLYLQVPLMIYYHLPTQKLRPFVGGGYVYGYLLEKNEPENPNLTFLGNDEMGFRLSAGTSLFSRKKSAISLEYSFEQTLLNRLLVSNKVFTNIHCFWVKYKF